VKNAIFSALFLSMVTLAACGGDPSADPMLNEAAPATVAPPATTVDVVATKCFDVGSDGVLHISGNVRFDGAVGINDNPLVGQGLTVFGSDTGILSHGGKVGVYTVGVGENSVGMSAIGTTGVNASGDIGVYGYSVSATGYGVWGDNNVAGGQGVHGFSYGPGSAGIIGEGAKDEATATEMTNLKTLVQQLQERINALEAHQQP
jgi:hypothetical protein